MARIPQKPQKGQPAIKELYKSVCDIIDYLPTLVVNGDQKSTYVTKSSAGTVIHATPNNFTVAHSNKYLAGDGLRLVSGNVFENALSGDGQTVIIRNNIITATGGGGSITITSGVGYPDYTALHAGNYYGVNGIGISFMLPVTSGSNINFYTEATGAVAFGTFASSLGQEYYRQELTNGQPYTTSANGWVRLSVFDNGTNEGKCLRFTDDYVDENHWDDATPLYKFHGLSTGGIQYTGQSPIHVNNATHVISYTGGTDPCSGLGHPDYQALRPGDYSSTSGQGISWLLPVEKGQSYEFDGGLSANGKVWGTYAPSLQTGPNPSYRRDAIANGHSFTPPQNGWVRVSAFDDGTISGACLRFYKSRGQGSVGMPLYKFGSNKATFEQTVPDHLSIGVYNTSPATIFSGDVVMFNTVRREATPEEIAEWGTRQNGDPKNAGWRGILYDGEGGVMTEVSIGVQIDNQEVQIPLIVPATTNEQLDTIAKIATDETVEVPIQLKNKAVEWALERITENKSPFYNGDEQDQQYRVIDDGRLMSGNIPVVPYISPSAVPWGIAVNTMNTGVTGYVDIMGVANVEVNTITTSGNYVTPNEEGQLELANSGYALFIRQLDNNKSLIILGGGDSSRETLSGDGVTVEIIDDIISGLYTGDGTTIDVNGGTISAKYVGDGSKIQVQGNTISWIGGAIGGGEFYAPDYNKLIVNNDAGENALGLGNTFLVPVKKGSVVRYSSDAGISATVVAVWAPVSGSQEPAFAVTTTNSNPTEDDGYVRISVIDPGTLTYGCLRLYVNGNALPLHKFAKFNYSETPSTVFNLLCSVTPNTLAIAKDNATGITTLSASGGGGGSYSSFSGFPNYGNKTLILDSQYKPLVKPDPSEDYWTPVTCTFTQPVWFIGNAQCQGDYNVPQSINIIFNPDNQNERYNHTIVYQQPAYGSTACSPISLPIPPNTPFRLEVQVDCIAPYFYRYYVFKCGTTQV